MSFINEEIPEEEKTKHDFHLLKMPTTKDPFRPWKWTIDYERKVFLVCIGGGANPEIPNFFAMRWKNEYIRADLFDGPITRDKEGSHIFYRVFNINIPEKLTSERDEVIKLLEEALAVYGLTYKQFDIQSAHLEFDKKDG